MAVVVIGRGNAKPDSEATMEAALRAVVEPSRREPGCLTYTLQRGLDDAGLFLTYERWESRADFEAHLKSAHVAQLFEALAGAVAASPEIVVLEEIA